MRTSMAYFAGAGTVIAAIGLGLGGGLTIANVMSPHQEKAEQTKLDQRVAAKPIPQSAQADQAKQQADAKPPVPYVAATNAAITANKPAEQTQSQPQMPSQPQPQAAAPAPQPSPQPAEAKVAKEHPAEARFAKEHPAKPAEPQKIAKPKSASHEQAAASVDDEKAKARSPEDANVKARSPEDASAKADDSDLKRLAAEKRKAQRRQQWAERKKAQQQRDAELRDGDARARRDTDRPLIRGNDGPRVVLEQDDDRPRNFDRRGDRRGDSDRPFGFPGFNLFGPDND